MTGSSKPQPLPDTTITERLASFPGWTRDGNALVRTESFPSFMEAIRFVNAVAEVAEKVDHHPDMTISYRKVTFRLSSHDAGGITERDLRLARAIDGLLAHGEHS
ncbi:MAG: 4a-hydroxytetrahydrobiopterin dehydratase [Candidatus Polarisedimenticolia bacterium]